MKFVRKPDRIYTIMDFADGEEIEFCGYPESPASKAAGYAYYKGKEGRSRLLRRDDIKMTNHEKIKSMSVGEMAEFLAMHIDHYRAPYEVKEIQQNSIDNSTGKGLTWIETFEKWLNSEVADE